MPYLFVFITYLLSLTGCPHHQAGKLKPDVQTLLFPLGDGQVVFKKSSYNGSTPYLFLQLHDNEVTAEEAAQQFLQEAGGVLLSIENGGARNITFTLNNQSYTFDPNRIFTPAGLAATLQKLGSNSPEAAAALKRFADSLLVHLPDSTLIVAVHNNTDSAFSINSYLSDTTYLRDAAAVNTNAAHDADDFFLTTDSTVYQTLAALQYNVILQNNEAATDDGSLSVYLGKKGVRYVNVEAEHGHVAFQLQMIKDLLQPKQAAKQQ